ncbi:unnamed protein product [Spodoptera littoralis]|uniref:Uncharacterized protein n=1 Tax=Spodoptera littoralis TaxID=7109 RepID=A0A9P0I2C7_SPOLI|nr:unnamed protein product [Spodoptera littoralis]CAH1638141.1 unnamed protein product [Spodoptera littoralis]
MKSTSIVQAATCFILIICCSAYPYEDIILSGHKARVYDVEGYTPHIPVTSNFLRQSSKTIYTKYPPANYTSDNNLSYQHITRAPLAQLPPHLVNQREIEP